MKTHPLLRFLAALILGLGLSTAARAHALWLDTVDGRVVFRFGDPGKKLETFPGSLERYVTLQAWTPVAEGKPTILTATPQADHLLFEAPATGIVLAENNAAAVSARKNQPPRKSFLYLRWQPAGLTADTPALTLDLLREASSLRVFFRGQPLAGAEIVLHGPDEKDEKFTTDAEGRVALPAVPAGLVILTTSHREPVSGFFNGQRYDAVGHSATLTWHQP